MSEKRALRILYSINGSPQYILAKSPAPVPVELIPSPQLGTDTNGASSSRSVAPPAPRFASASFKTCLNVICRSSPELIQDRARDFSVYLLDPLETECPPAQTNRLPQAPTPDSPLEARVAVGLGLMSWELKSDETEVRPVTGTLKVSGTGQEVLEIIFSLREAMAMEKAALPEALRSWSEPGPSTSQRATSSQREKKPGPYPSRKPKPNAPVTHSDMFLSAPIYIGPERISGPGGIRRRPVDEEVEGPQRRDNSGNDPPPLLDLLAFLQAMSPNSERNKALGNVLGLVHGSDGTAVRPPTELENAMTLFSDLRASGPHPPKYPPQPAPQYPHHPFPPPSHPSQPATASSSHSQHRRKSSSTDDEIVVLNKENVNPTVFRRRSERDGKLLPAAEPSTAPASLSSAPPASSSSSSGHPLPASLLPTRPPPPSLLPPRPFLTQSQPSRLALSNPSSSQPLRRKRTLSEFMEEQEAARERERASKKDYYRQPERSMSEGDFTFFLKTKSTTTAKPTRRPQVRRRTASTASSPGPEVEQELPVVSASSPPRPPRRKFTLPDWARTDTATQPRLAEDLVLKVQEDEKKKKEDERKKREAKRKEVRAERVERGEFGRRKRQGTAPPAPAAAQRRKTLTRTSTLVTANGLSLPAPVAASGEFPAFTTTRPPLAPVGSPSRSMSKSTTSPCTPPRKRRANTISTPGDASLFTPGSALFTPASASWEARGTFDLGRRSMSPTSRKARTPDPDKSTQSNEEPESDEDDNLLGQELNSAFDELDFPSNSLPVASSDNDAHVETEQLPNSSPQYSDDSDNEVDAPPKQHWVGLPPSSPPPPSSPYLGPSATNEDDVEELPVPTSDAEPTSELNSPSTEITNYSIEELGQLLNIDDLANFFPAAGTDNANVTLDSAVNLLDQFAENNHLELASSDSVQTMKDWGLDQVNPDFDFTEFWESVRPLVEGGADPNNSVASSGMEAGFGIDNAKLAGDVHALFSGCLV